MRLEHEFRIESSIERVWEFLLDVPQMAGCIPGTTDLRKFDDTTFDATIAAKIGPIAARFGCRISVEDLDSQAHTGAVRVTGKDSKLGSGVSARMEMTVTAVDGGSTAVHIVSDVDVFGKIGQYGHGMIAKRADAMFADFASCARAKLA